MNRNIYTGTETFIIIIDMFNVAQIMSIIARSMGNARKKTIIIINNDK